MRIPMQFVGALALGTLLVAPATAQEVVHALSGTLTKVNRQARTIQVRTNDGSEGVFNFPRQGTDMDFDRDVKQETTPVASFSKQAGTVIVFYYGNNATRTAVAVKDLGSGPFDTVEGTVTKFNKHQHTLSVKDNSGKEHNFQLDPKAVADSMNGAVSGDKFDPQKGDNVRVIASGSGGTETALFVRD